MDWVKTTARGYKKHLNFGIWCDLSLRFYGNLTMDCGGYKSDNELTKDTPYIYAMVCLFFSILEKADHL